MSEAFNGQKLRTIRKQRGLTMQQLAEQANVSTGQISQIERGQVIPTLVLFWKLCKVLDVPLHVFFEDDNGQDDEHVVVRKDQRKQIHFPNSNVVYHSLTPHSKGELDFLLIEIQPGEAHEREQQVSHGGEECGFVQQGQLTVLYGDKRYVLEAGDSISFQSTVPHRFMNEGTETSISIWAMTQPRSAE
ncbi:cupin domain-containing protein [Paenibacillus mesophilus]|uniref:cupin domain-containing protein n=1 Tax=Paenibacillus mesophilus TaxID=2582849 RepID=UPI00110F54DD|nr:cupin domain-containing protein [Paenibacillus mesophilus]TMV45448.1 cupin domain-containing protein [Paenibacillus mesophilus]